MAGSGGIESNGGRVTITAQVLVGAPWLTAMCTTIS
jgi:hypothetical protein